MRLVLNFILIGTLALLSGCSQPISKRIKSADKLATSNKFTPRIIKGGDFWLASYQRIDNPSKPYVFYVEGDGKVMSNKYTVSENPTPESKTMLELAVMDPRPNVVYLARPCQFTPIELNPLCKNNVYWTDKRLAKEVIDGMADAIFAIATENPVDLIGFSGGGGVISLIAAKNKNKLKINSIITIAGLLDHVAFNYKHRTKPMLGSLNPIDYAEQIKYIPQLHLSGGRDTVVPAFIADSFTRKSNSICVKHEITPNASHHSGWDQVWPNVLSKLPLTCY